MVVGSGTSRSMALRRESTGGGLDRISDASRRSRCLGDPVVSSSSCGRGWYSLRRDGLTKSMVRVQMM